MAILSALSHIARRIVRLLLPAVVVGLSCLDAAAQQPLEYQVKAAYLLNFTKFIEWPPAAFADARSPLAICILGQDPFGSTLNQMVKGEAVNGRALVIQRIRSAPPPRSCQVLFIPKAGTEASEVLSEPSPGVLTVGEGETFLHDGGIVAFIVENRRVRFDINQSAAGNAMLTISSRLLNVARSVHK